MDLPKHFKKFEQNIRLNPSRDRTLRKGFERLQSFVDEDAQLASFVLSAPIIQGSFAHDTVVRPLRAGTYDVDILLPLDLTRLMREKNLGGREVFQFIHNRLKKEYSAGVEKRGKCLRITFAKGFRIDLVPGEPLDGLGGSYRIVDRERNQFIRTNPVGFTAWVSELNEQTQQCFSPCVAMLKRWREVQRFARATAPKSILLTALAGTSYQQYIDESRLELASRTGMTPQYLVSDLAQTMLRYVHDYQRGRIRRLPIPGSEQEDLFASFEAWPRFVERLEHFVEYSTKANAQANQKFALNHWQRIFGREFLRNA